MRQPDLLARKVIRQSLGGWNREKEYMKEIINSSIHTTDHERRKSGKHLTCKRLVWKLGDKEERA